MATFHLLNSLDGLPVRGSVSPGGLRDGLLARLIGLRPSVSLDERPQTQLPLPPVQLPVQSLSVTPHRPPEEEENEDSDQGR